MSLTVPTVLDTLRAVIDPDLGINVVDLGLVEGVEVDAATVRVGLIMTSPACPQGGYLRDEAARRIARAAAPGTAVRVEVLAAPLWGPERLSPAARAALGWPG